MKKKTHHSTAHHNLTITITYGLFGGKGGGENTEKLRNMIYVGYIEKIQLARLSFFFQVV
jgi:hypothetical protein